MRWMLRHTRLLPVLGLALAHEVLEAMEEVSGR